MSKIGPNFYNELKSAGLIGLPFSWGDDGSFQFGSSMTDAQIAAVQAAVAAHDPAKMQYSPAAQAALLATDTTMHRIGEAVALGLTTWMTADVVAFVSYRRTLRTIVDGAQAGPLPAKPAYPAGT